MAGTKIQVGQVWRQNDTGKSYLVTKLYNEALSTMVVLRDTNDHAAKPLRVKISKSAHGQTIPGFSPTQITESV
jgi:hypothetical protein